MDVPVGLTTIFPFQSAQEVYDMEELKKYCPDPQPMTNYGSVVYSTEPSNGGGGGGDVLFVTCLLKK